jgi:hypothetical protein
LKETVNFNCTNKIGETKKIVFFEAANTDLVLGATSKTYAINRKGVPKDE